MPPAPLSGLNVLEFGTLLPGPMTGLMLAEAGARVVKIERPPHGDPMREYEPRIDGDSVHFHALNRGKQSLFLDLKTPESHAVLRPLIEVADVLIEPFRPGVMTRLGLGYEAVRALNPGIIYCSLTGWGQTGPKAGTAAHDLNFMAESGLLDRTCGTDGAPVLPHSLTADIAGGVYPAVINILLAYISKCRTGMGTHLDIAIFDGLMTFHYDTIVPALSLASWPQRGADLVTGGSPRYHLYLTSDGRHLAVAAMEDRFWRNFCALIELPVEYQSNQKPKELVTAAIQAIIIQRTSLEWSQTIAGHDACCSIVADFNEVLNDEQLRSRGIFSGEISVDPETTISALPLPIAPQFRCGSALLRAPRRAG